MTMHPRKGDKKRTLNHRELEAIKSALAQVVPRTPADTDLLTDLENAKRVTIVTTKR